MRFTIEELVKNLDPGFKYKKHRVEGMSGYITTEDDQFVDILDMQGQSLVGTYCLVSDSIHQGSTLVEMWVIVRITSVKPNFLGEYDIRVGDGSSTWRASGLHPLSILKG
jgi:hypothetical protein